MCFENENRYGTLDVLYVVYVCIDEDKLKEKKLDIVT